MNKHQRTPNIMLIQNMYHMRGQTVTKLNLLVINGHEQMLNFTY